MIGVGIDRELGAPASPPGVTRIYGSAKNGPEQTFKLHDTHKNLLDLRGASKVIVWMWEERVPNAVAAFPQRAKILKAPPGTIRALIPTRPGRYRMMCEIVWEGGIHQWGAEESVWVMRDF